MAFAALGAQKFTPAAISKSLGCSFVRFNLWQLLSPECDDSQMVQTNWGTTPSPVLSSALCYLLPGLRIISIVRPSRRGSRST
jgi:hypothetical protein